MEYLVVKEVTKTFGPVIANDKVNLSIRKGEVHAILGENGSGKSTLMNIISGIYAQDSGEIYLDGKQSTISSPEEAIKLGVGMIHQHFKLINVLSALDNIVGGMDTAFVLPRKKVRREILGLCKKYGFDIDLDKKVYNMSISEKQNVEIIKALYRGASLLILDEPTAVLTPQETERLFAILRDMKKENCAIIIITHKLNEVMSVSDRVTVFRKGSSVATVNTAQTSAQELTEMMVGRRIDLQIERPDIDKSLSRPVVKVKELTVVDHMRKTRINHVDLTINSHEILGIAGIAGSGQKELCEALTGQIKASGSIEVEGQEIIGNPPSTLQKMGIHIGFVPEDRLGMGLVGGMSVQDNVILKSYRDTKGLFMDRKAAQEKANSIIERYEVSTPGSSQIIKRLSGGNIQKVLLGREIDANPRFLIAAYPVRGLDIGASYFVYDRLNEQKKAGVAILLVGEDLDVLMALCDRIAVIHDGKIMGIVNAASTTKEQLGLMMIGETGGVA